MTRFDNYARVEEINGALEDLLGSGIANVNGEEWKLQRKMASPEFSPNSLRSFLNDKVQYQIDKRLVPLLRDASNSGRVLDLQDLLERLAFDIICNLVLGVQPDCLCKKRGEGERFYQAFREATDMSIKRGMKTSVSTWRLKRLLNIGSERRLKESVAIVHEFVENSVKLRRLQRNIGGDDSGGDFLSRFVHNDESLSDEFLRDMLINFLIAGDTTPSALTWFFWNLSSNPDVVTKIQKELKSIRSLHNPEAFTLNKLRDMNYLHAAISESMRLYPSIPLVPKKCLGDDVLPDGTPVQKGWMVFYNSYAMARKEAIWGEDCGEFRPERWLDVEGVFKQRNAFEFPVFHAGPRACLGKEMAYLQMKAVATSVLERFEVEVVEERGEVEYGLTVSLRGGLPVKIKERRV